MNSRFSFQKGWAHVKQGDARAVRAKLMTALDITSRVSFLDRMKGKIEPLVTEAEAIERVFAEYGITDCWGHVQGITEISEAV